MATPVIYDFPADIFPEYGTGGYCEPVSIVDMFTASNGHHQAVLRGAGELWRQEFTIITHGDSERTLAAFLMRVRGQANIIRCPDLFQMSRYIKANGGQLFPGSSPIYDDTFPKNYYHDGVGYAVSSAPTATLDGAHSLGDTTITVSINFNDPTVLRSLDRIQVGDHLYAVLSYDYTTGDVEIMPPLRAAYADGVTVVVFNAKGLWKLSSNADMIPEHVTNTPDGPARRRKITLIETLGV
jgi:hypothetical protein